MRHLILSMELRYQNGLYADGGGDRRVTHLQVQKALITVFIHHDLDELIAARPAAYHSYRNPV